MKSKIVAILETRTGAHLAELISRRGAIPMLAPALEEVPDVEPQTVTTLLQQWRAHPFNSAVQVQNLYAVAESMNRAGELAGHLNAVVIASVGPVCSRALMQHGVKPTFEANPPKLGLLVARLEEEMRVR